MNTTIKALSVVLAALSLLGCPVDDVLEVDQAAQDVAACSGVPIPGAEIVLGRTTGAPNTSSMELPALTAVCLKVETNTASGDVHLDEAEVFHESEFKNKEQVLYRSLEGLEPEQHLVTAEIRSTPEDHYMKVTAYYPTGGLASGSEINSVDEALLVGQAYITRNAEGQTDLWNNASAIRVTELMTSDGLLEAFEIDVQSSEGEEAGYVVLERNELRPLLGSSFTEGPSLTEILGQEYTSQYGSSFAADGQYRFLWAGLGAMALEVTLPDNTVRIVRTCDQSECPGVTFESTDRAGLDFEWLETSPDAWVEERREYVNSMLDALLGEGMGIVEDAQTPGFFGVPENQAESSEIFAVPDASPALACAPVLSNSVPGGAGAFSNYYQGPVALWPETGNLNPGLCKLGCTPVAAGILFEYWDHRYPYLISDSNGLDNDSVDDTDVKAALTHLRLVLETKCKDGQGATVPSNYDNLNSYVNTRAQVLDAGWSINTDPYTNVSWDDRLSSIRTTVRKGHPALIHYVSLVNGPTDKDLNHTAVVYGYKSDGYVNRQEDVIWVRTGWNVNTAAEIPVVGQGEMYITHVDPNCSLTGDTNLCMDFNDITDGHWGQQAAETLSCMCVMRGQSDGSFLPEDTITKAEFLKVVLKLAFAPPEVDLDGERADPGLGVCFGHWASGYINFAKNEGMLGAPVLNGGLFLADAPITRKEVAYLLVQAGHHLKSDDLDQTSPYWTFQQMYKDFDCYEDTNTLGNNPYADLAYTAAYYDRILATTNRCVFEGRKVNPNSPNSPRNFLPNDPISRIEAAKVACTARFGPESEICSTQHDCLPLAGTLPVCP